MKHSKAAASLAALVGALTLGTIGMSTAALAGTPVGYWLKEDGAAKLQIEVCGSNQLCSKIVWLRDPVDSKGQPLHDARNENPSLRGRPIIGLPIFQGLVSDGPNSWKGHIYNPEDGGTYKASLTLVSSNQIVLKGCLAMFLCGQKTWTRTEFAPQPAAPEEPKQIEVKTAPEEPHAAAAPKVEEAVSKPEPEEKPAEPRRIEASVGGLPRAFTPNILKPALPPAHRDATAGFGFVLTTASPDQAPQFEEGDPSNMYLVTPGAEAPMPVTLGPKADSEPAADERPQQTASAEPSAPAPAPAAAPAPAPEQVAYAGRAAAPDPAATGSLQVSDVPMPDQRPPELDAYAEAQALAAQDHLSWRDRRRLKKLRRENPWMDPANAPVTAPVTPGVQAQTAPGVPAQAAAPQTTAYAAQ